MATNLFDPNFYRQANPDLASLPDDGAFAHFINFGVNEGRRFSPYVDLNVYRTANPDLAAAGLRTNRQLYDHLSSSGVAEGRIFSNVFDVNFYRAVNPDLAVVGFNNEQLFDHFRFSGINEGRFASPVFNAPFYLNANPDLAAIGFNFAQGLNHYLLSGMFEGRLTAPFPLSGLSPNFSIISTGNGRVGQLNSLTGAFSEISRGPDFTDIALSVNGQLFGVTFNSLYEIDPITGESFQVGNLGSSGFNALGFTNDNRLFAARNSDSSLYQIDTQTGRATVFANFGSGLESSGDMAFDPLTQRFFLTADGSSSDILVSVGLDGSALRIGNIGFNNIFGLDLENGELIGYTSGGDRISINRTSGQGTFLGEVPGVSGAIFGAA